MRAVTIEPAAPEDLNYIRSSWMRAYQSSAVGKALGQAYGTWRLVVEACLGNGAIIVARPAVDAADTVLGWACISMDSSTLHFAYVRETHRGLGIATQMLEGHALTAKTHLMQGKFDALRYVGYSPGHGPGVHPIS